MYRRGTRPPAALAWISATTLRTRRDSGVSRTGSSVYTCTHAIHRASFGQASASHIGAWCGRGRGLPYRVRVHALDVLDAKQVL